MIKTELLAPAGSYETMKAAFHAGADAVYIGGQAFGARAYADNPDEDQLLAAIRFAHIHGKRLYLTVNTLLKEEELNGKLDRYLRPYYEEGLDAVIVQDLGVLRFIREFFPDLPVHASTQMTITGGLSARHLEELGAVRVVTPRELSLEEIREIRNSCGLEIESFVHGALCYCYSGQCLFSSIAGGRSGNRGRCAQPCRMAYRLFEDGKQLAGEEKGYLLSPKDLNTLAILPDLLAAGVNSLKIEGRMKKPEYTSGVVSIYRKYLDRYLERGKEGYRAEKEDEKKLFDLFNRKGFTDGYYKRHNGSSMITLTKPELRPENEALNRFLRDTYINTDLKEKIKGKVMIFSGKPVTIQLTAGTIRLISEGEPAQEAVGHPLLKEDILRCMEKIKDTCFEWEKLEIETDEKSFVPIGKLNAFRRKAMEELSEKICAPYKRIETAAEISEIPQTIESAYSQEEAERKEKFCWYAQAETAAQLGPILKEDWIGRVYLDSHMAENAKEWNRLIKETGDSGKECFIVLPKVFRKEAGIWADKNLKMLLEAGCGGFLAGMAEGLMAVKRKCPGAKVVGDHTLYAFSKLAEEEWKEWGADSLTAPVELNGSELKKRGLKGMETIVYGYLPMMITAQCQHKTMGKCIGRTKDMDLEDRMGNHFCVRNYCRECYSMIFNSLPLFLGGELDAIRADGASAARFLFTKETEAETKEILKLFRAYAKGEGLKEKPDSFTRGHWKRGVE